MPKAVKKISDLKPDPNNANKGSDRGRKAVDDSLTKYGAGRSIVVDQNGVVIGGNKTLEAAKAAGIEVEVIHTRGDKLVVVQRDDLDLLKDHKARKLAYADNRAGELGLEWDLDQIKADIDAGMILDDLFEIEFLEKTAGIDISEPGAGDPLDGLVPEGDRYQEQYAVIIVCESEEHQEQVYNKMSEGGYTCRVVTT